MKNFLKALREILSCDGQLSSKRVAGVLGFLCAVVMIFTGLGSAELVKYLLFISAGLLASGLVDNWLSK